VLLCLCRGSCPDSVHHLLFLSPVVYPSFTSPFDCETQTSAPLNDTHTLSLSLSKQSFPPVPLQTVTNLQPYAFSFSSFFFFLFLHFFTSINTANHHESVRCCGCGRRAVCGVADSSRRALCGGEEQHNRSFAAQDAD